MTWIDHDLLDEARRRKRLQAAKHFGSIDLDPSYDYKKERQAR